MKKILVSLMTICLVGGLIGGGLFADFSDIETSRDNYFKIGSLDLKVSDYLGVEYQDPDVPAFIQYTDAWPCSDKSYYMDLENWGQGSQFVPWAYIHFKNIECGWVVPKNVYAWVNEDGTLVPEDQWPDLTPGTQGTDWPKPLNEPEYVAELGGIAGEDVNGNEVIVPGVGLCFGEDCQLAEHIGVMIWVAGPWPHEEKPVYNDPTIEWTLVYNGKFDELVCQQLELGQIPNCNGIWIHMSLHLQDIDEDDLIADGVLTDPGTGYGWFDDTIPAEFKWDHWPTNALQKDGLEFDMAFELLQNKA